MRRGASGYYSAQLSNVDGDILDRWSSIPIRGGRIIDITLRVDGRASITESIPLVPATSAAKLVSGILAPVVNIDRGLTLANMSSRLTGPTLETFALFQNSPNPLNPATQIRYNLPEASSVKLTVFHALGQEVARLVNATQSAGAYTVAWDAAEVSSGLYYYQLEAGTFKDVRKMLLVK